MSNLVFFFTRSPTENTVVSDAFDAVVTAAIFDEKLSLIFEENSWDNFVSKKHNDGMISIIVSKLQTLTSMTSINIFIKSQKCIKSTSNELITTEALTRFFDEASCKTKIIDNNEFQILLKESDKVLSY